MPSTSPDPLSPHARPGRRVPASVPFGLALAAVLLLAMNLRPGATTLGPVMQEVSAALGLSGGLAGLLAALPGIVFGAVGFVAVRVGGRLGMSATLALGAGLAAAGLAGRAVVDDVTPFLLLTVLALSGMALGNVLIPAWVKLHAASRTTMLMTVYSASLTLGGSTAALVTAPIAAAAGADGWRWALGAWGLAALAPLAVWAAVAWRTGHDFPRILTPEGGGVSLLRSPTALALTLLFGVQSMNAYVQFGWVPQMLRDAGLSAGAAGTSLGVTAGLGVVGALMMPTVISRSRNLKAWMVLFGAMTTLGYVGMLAAPVAGVWLWAAVLGLGGFAFPTVITLLAARTRDPHVTARLSGFAQPVGYVLAAIGPFAVGLLHDLTGGWTLVFVLLAASGVVMAAAGLRASEPVYVDDELAARA
ncbi:MFS transporter [Micrococcus endophyticus]|uniref:CP family cyanate transporter-like MFS transporter n=1 Tax=Micrococcus endophyticus TaxID=455343 RepID=A0A7W9N162_9MICC|nr:CP family cyanate transporter-like MFS transporter [Micrococcus endophyticus]